MSVFLYQDRKTVRAVVHAILSDNACAFFRLFYDIKFFRLFNIVTFDNIKV